MEHLSEVRFHFEVQEHLAAGQNQHRQLQHRRTNSLLSPFRSPKKKKPGNPPACDRYVGVPVPSLASRKPLPLSDSFGKRLCVLSGPLGLWGVCSLGSATNSRIRYGTPELLKFGRRSATTGRTRAARRERDSHRANYHDNNVRCTTMTDELRYIALRCLKKLALHVPVEQLLCNPQLAVAQTIRSRIGAEIHSAGNEPVSLQNEMNPSDDVPRAFPLAKASSARRPSRRLASGCVSMSTCFTFSQAVVPISAKRRIFHILLPPPQSNASHSLALSRYLCPEIAELLGRPYGKTNDALSGWLGGLPPRT